MVDFRLFNKDDLGSKGFTLVQVMGAIAALGIVGSFLYSLLSNTERDIKSRTYEMQSNYAVDHISTLMMDQVACGNSFRGLVLPAVGSSTSATVIRDRLSIDFIRSTCTGTSVFDGAYDPCRFGVGNKNSLILQSIRLARSSTSPNTKATLTLTLIKGGTAVGTATTASSVNAQINFSGKTTIVRQMTLNVGLSGSTLQECYFDQSSPGGDDISVGPCALLDGYLDTDLGCKRVTIDWPGSATATTATTGTDFSLQTDGLHLRGGLQVSGNMLIRGALRVGSLSTDIPGGYPNTDANSPGGSGNAYVNSLTNAPQAASGVGITYSTGSLFGARTGGLDVGRSLIIDSNLNSAPNAALGISNSLPTSLSSGDVYVEGTTSSSVMRMTFSPISGADNWTSNSNSAVALQQVSRRIAATLGLDAAAVNSIFDDLMTTASPSGQGAANMLASFCANWRLNSAELPNAGSPGYSSPAAVSGVMSAGECLLNVAYLRENNCGSATAGAAKCWRVYGTAFKPSTDAGFSLSSGSHPPIKVYGTTVRNTNPYYPLVGGSCPGYTYTEGYCNGNEVLVGIEFNVTQPFIGWVSPTMATGPGCGGPYSYYYYRLRCAQVSP